MNKETCELIGIALGMLLSALALRLMCLAERRRMENDMPSA
ncbi:MAG: hypothetical protein WCV86_00940 [Patescibacteria group bacterium]|jgi:hypothetical protein